MKRLLALLLLLAASASAQTTVTIDGFDYTIPDHPRIFLDGPSGPITTRLKDPDGAGALKAPRAIDGDPAYEGLKTLVRACAAAGEPYGCISAPAQRLAHYELVPLFALDWFMDNSQTNSLAAAKWALNNAERFFNIPQAVPTELGCIVHSNYCDMQDYNHWASYILIFLSQAYSVIRSEMTAGERLAFARKMVNDVTVMYGDTCDDQYQPVTGAVVSHYVTGSTTVTGTGFAGIAPGTSLHIRSNLTVDGGFAVVNTVTDTQLTLAAPLRIYSGGNLAGWGPGATQGRIWELGPITATTCGATWQAGNHLSNHVTTFGRRYQTAQAEPLDATETDVSVASGAGFPAPPFLVTHGQGGEWMLVTAVNGNVLTVQRDWPRLDGTGIAAFSGTITYNKMHPNGARDGDPRNNRILLKTTGALAAGLGALDDVPGFSENYIDQAGWFVKDYQIPTLRTNWAGITQGGAYYNYHINIPYALSLVDITRHFTPVGAAPSLDYSQDGWVEKFIYGLIYNGIPASVNTPIMWGTPGLPLADSTWWVTFFNGFRPNATSTKHINFWLTDRSGIWDETMASFETYVMFSLIHMPTAPIPTEDYRTILPKHRALDDVDEPPGRPYGVWISRTGFSSASDSLVWVSAEQRHYGMTDHMTAGAPGAYRWYRRGYILTEPVTDNTNVSSGAATNMLLFGGLANVKVYTATGQWQEVWIDRKDGADTWAYARINSLNALTSAAAATRSLRHMVHFKAGDPDFLVVYDDAASNVGKTKSQNIHHDEATGACPTYSFVSPNATCRNTLTSGHMNIVLPSGSNLVTAASTVTNGKRVNICISADGTTCDATNLAGDFLIVHQTSADPQAAQVAATLLGTIDSDFRGVEIGGSNPAVAVFPKVGLSYTSSSFTTTHTGTATYVVTGLTPGAYDVIRGGVTTVLDDHVVDADEVLSFTSVSGAFTVSQGDPPPPECTIATNSLPNATDSVAYSHQLVKSGCTGAVTWTKETDTCPEIDITTGGLIEQADPDIGTCTETYKVTDSLAQFGTKELPLTTVAAPATCIITSPTSLPDAVQGVAYSFTLTTSGCTGPMTFTPTPTDFCPGLLLNSGTGAFSDSPDVVGLCTFDVGLVPTAGGNTSKQHTILVNAPPAAELQILTTTPLPDCVRGQPCSTTFTSAGGTPPTTWSKASGTYCVGNDQLNANTGVLSGPGTVFETCTFEMLVTDSASPTPDTDQRTFQRTIINPDPNMAVTVTTGSSGAIVKFGTPSLDRDQPCEAVVSDQTINPDTGVSIGVVATAISSSGYATRIVSVSGLTPEHPHQVVVDCGDVASGSAFFTTVAAVGGTVNRVQRATPSAGLVARGAVKISWYATRLDTSGDVQVLHSACSPGPCDVTLTLVSGGNYSIAHAWETSGDVEITRSVRPQFVAVP